VRAARLLDMLLVLQRRGRLTARELGEVLEVSERTILRDVEALSEAGVPILTSRGSGGGIDLIGGFETRLTGLTLQEAECLFLMGQPVLADNLGLGSATRSVQHKLVTALPPAFAGEPERLAGWLVNDPTPWADDPVARPELRRIVSCIRRGRRLEIQLAHRQPVLLEPLGLALKAGSWHLVFRIENEISVTCLDQLRSTRLTRQRFEPPESFSLPEFWAAYVTERRPRRAQ
jgi:predicted DNA-binding transcriptional regulator YafY